MSAKKLVGTFLLWAVLWTAWPLLFETRSIDIAWAGSQFTRTAQLLPSDYALESLEIRDHQGGTVVAVNNEFFFPYNGVQTPGQAIVWVRWNRGRQTSECRVRVELTLRYLSRRTGGVLSLGTFDVRGFDANGLAQVSVPFAIQAGERNGALVNVQANLLVSGDGECDSNAANNSRGTNLTLREFVPIHDLVIRLDPADFRLTKVTVYSHQMNPGLRVSGPTRYDWYRFYHKARVRNLSTGPVGLIDKVKVKWEIQGRHDPRAEYRRWRGGHFFVESVGRSEWVVQDFSSHSNDSGDQTGAFFSRKNHWDPVRLIVEVDPDREFRDNIRANNRVVYQFQLK